MPLPFFLSLPAREGIHFLRLLMRLLARLLRCLLICNPPIRLMSIIVRLGVRNRYKDTAWFVHKPNCEIQMIGFAPNIWIARNSLTCKELGVCYSSVIQFAEFRHGTEFALLAFLCPFFGTTHAAIRVARLSPTAQLALQFATAKTLQPDG